MANRDCHFVELLNRDERITIFVEYVEDVLHLCPRVTRLVFVGHQSEEIGEIGGVGMGVEGGDQGAQPFLTAPPLSENADNEEMSICEHP